MNVTNFPSVPSYVVYTIKENAHWTSVNGDADLTMDMLPEYETLVRDELRTLVASGRVSDAVEFAEYAYIFVATSPDLYEETNDFIAGLNEELPDTDRITFSMSDSR